MARLTGRLLGELRLLSGSAAVQVRDKDLYIFAAGGRRQGHRVAASGDADGGDVDGGVTVLADDLVPVLLVAHRRADAAAVEGDGDAAVLALDQEEALAMGPQVVHVLVHVAVGQLGYGDADTPPMVGDGDGGRVVAAAGQHRGHRQ